MLHLTLRQLQVFEVAATNLNFSLTAKQLFLSQPAVSMQIKQLEENIGLPLFEHIGKKVFLTEAGNELLHYSRNLSQQLKEMDVLFSEMKGLEHGKLTLSVVNTANHFTPQLLAGFCRRYPNINVILQVANRDAVLKQLADNSTDLAILGQPPDGMDISAESFLDNPLVVIATPDHPFAKLKRVKFARLATETFLSREPGSGTRSAMERIFAEHKIQPHISMEMETNEAIKQAVRAGMGLGILSLHSIELELETKRIAILDVERFPIMRHWHIVQRKNKRLSTAAQAFKQFLLNEAERLAAPMHHKLKRAKRQAT